MQHLWNNVKKSNKIGQGVKVSTFVFAEFLNTGVLFLEGSLGAGVVIYGEN